MKSRMPLFRHVAWRITALLVLTLMLPLPCRAGFVSNLQLAPVWSSQESATAPEPSLALRETPEQAGEQNPGHETGQRPAESKQNAL